jgi:hypothetical protein
MYMHKSLFSTVLSIEWVNDATNDGDAPATIEVDRFVV